MYYYEHMMRVTKRELNQRTAAVLASVTATNEIVVTERGKPRWRVSVAQDRDNTLDRLERDGRYTPAATSPAPWPSRPGGPAHSEAEVDALLDALRGDH